MRQTLSSAVLLAARCRLRYFVQTNRLGTAFVVLLLIGTDARGQEAVVVGWTIDSNTPGSIAASYSGTGITDIPLSRGPGISPRLDAGPFYLSNYFSTGGLDLKDYYQWGFTSDHPLDLLYVNVAARVDSVWGPFSRTMHASFDGGDFVYVGRPGTTSAQISVDLSAHMDIQTATFRLYGYGANGPQGNMRIENAYPAPSYAQAIQVVAVPEPSTLVLVCMGAVGLLFLRRREQSVATFHRGYRFTSCMPVLVALAFYVPIAQGGTIDRPPTRSAANDRTGHIYWTGFNDTGVWRARLDGSDVSQLVADVSGYGIAVDGRYGHVYWSDRVNRRISRADFDGSNVVDAIVVPDMLPEQIVLDLGADRIYWADAGLDGIMRANLDGTGVTQIISGRYEAEGVALDLSRGKIYWTDLSRDTIERANLDGTSIETVVDIPASNPLHLAVDEQNRKIYWAENSRFLRRADLDGTDPEAITPQFAGNTKGLALDVAGGMIYWPLYGPVDKIHRAELTGANIEEIVSFPVGFPTVIALHVVPEPSTFTLTALTLLGLLVWGWQRKR